MASLISHRGMKRVWKEGSDLEIFVAEILHALQLAAALFFRAKKIIVCLPSKDTREK
jgi:hypothetical protein